MARRPLKSATPLDVRQEELARREHELRERMQKLQRMIEDAPRIAEERTRQHREEVKKRANVGGSRLDAAVSLRDRRWGDEESRARRRGSLRKERRDGRIVFVVLCLALAAIVVWLLTRFQF